MEQEVIAHTQKWIKSVVVDLNFCPFAAKALMQKSIRYVVMNKANTKSVLELLLPELQKLDEHPEIETGFIIFTNDFKDFSAYLKLVKQTERLLSNHGYDGIYQLASFHPDYCFAGADDNDAANFTNRSPYPMLHILREESISKALRTFKNPQSIPERNVELAREKGLKYMQVLRSACFS